MKMLGGSQENGKIPIRILELNIAHNCNLKCRRCSHLSPAADSYFMQPVQLLNDLKLLAKYVQPQQIRLLGGEPLLHPELLAIIDAVKDSGISGSIRVVTNGILLAKMPDIFWQKIDQLQITLYPGIQIAAHMLKRYRLRAEKFGVFMSLRYVNRFREAYAEAGTTDNKLIKRIFSTCRITHVWGCYTIHEGYFYRCSLSLLFPLYLDSMKLPDHTADGLQLEASPDFRNRLRNFLKSQKPLAACRFCLGSVGKRFFPEQETKAPAAAGRSTEDLLDRRYLKFYELVGNHSFAPRMLQFFRPFKTALARWAGKYNISKR